MTLNFAPESNKPEVFSKVEEFLHALHLTLVNKDATRPWGGFFVIEERQAPEFAKLFFSHLNFSDIKIGKLSPKILIVEPGKRLSWQYHHRRSEIWKVIGGEAGVVTSMTDEQGSVKKLGNGDTVQLMQGERHRLVGLQTWGIIAEIWQHVDAQHPSDEEDIVRVEDDFGR